MKKTKEPFTPLALLTNGFEYEAVKNFHLAKYPLINTESTLVDIRKVVSEMFSDISISEAYISFYKDLPQERYAVVKFLVVEEPKVS